MPNMMVKATSPSAATNGVGEFTTIARRASTVDIAKNREAKGYRLQLE